MDEDAHIIYMSTHIYMLHLAARAPKQIITTIIATRVVAGGCRKDANQHSAAFDGDDSARHHSSARYTYVVFV